MSHFRGKGKIETGSSALASQSGEDLYYQQIESNLDSEFCGSSKKDRSKKVETQIVRCTEITCMYSSADESTKCQKSQQEDSNFIKCESVSKSSEWKKVVNAHLDVDNDIILEVDTGTGDVNCGGLKDVQAVELVIAVQSAIKQRQELIEEWKNKTICLTDQIEKLNNEKYLLEKSNLSKDSELECLANKLHELHKQYKNLSHDSNKLKNDLESLKREYNSLTQAYNMTVCELKDTKSKLAEAIQAEQTLESRFRHQVGNNEKLERKSKQLEMELEESRKQIKSLTCSLEETSKELLAIKDTLEEYKIIEAKLKSLRVQYKSLKEKYETIEHSLNKAFEDNSSLKEIISKLNLTIENLTADKNELVIAVQCLNNEKNSIVERNSRLVKDLNHAKQNFSKAQSQLRSVQSDVDCLKMKIEELESCNKNLYDELNGARHENKNLNNNLKSTIVECTTLSRALAEAQCQLETQQKALVKVESKVRCLLQEKQNLENLIGNLNDDKKNNSAEISRLNGENISVRNQNNDLICNLNKVTLELNESLTEIKHLSNEIEQLRHTVETERIKHENHITKLQDKIRKKSQEWKEYVTNEIQRLRNKRRADIKKYLEVNRDLENRLQNIQEHDSIVENELNANIIELKKQLEAARRKLEESICEAIAEKNEIIEKANAEHSRMKEFLEKQKLESQWLSTELESKIQNLVQKNLDDEATIHLLKKESSSIKEKLRKLTGEHEKLQACKHSVKSLLETKHTLECELTNCKSLLSLSEETTNNLREENSEIVKRLKNEEENVKSLQTKVVKLKRIIGKKDAQIEVLKNTITQLKDQINHFSEENACLRNSLEEFEQKHLQLTEKVRFLNQELSDAKRALCETGDDKKALIDTVKEIEREINKLESENACLKSELQTAKENQYLTEKSLENSHNVQIQLKERVIKAETAASKSAHEARHLESKIAKMQEHVKKLEGDLHALSEAYQYNDSQHKKKIESLECQLSSANEEITILRQQLEKSEKRIHRLRESLRESEKSFYGLIAIFDSLRETLSQVLCIEYTQISTETCRESSKLNDSTKKTDSSFILKSYKSEVEIYSKSLTDLKRNETEIGCKLANTKKDFEKLSHIMKELQAEYSHKVEKLYRNLKEKEDLTKELEKQLVKIQLEAAEADEVLACSLKLKIEEQQNYIRKLQDEKSILQSEILCLAKKVNELECQIFELVEKLKCVENKNSKLQIKNVSLEGDLEKLILLLKEARDKEQEQICQYKQMMLANRELMDKIRHLKHQLERGTKDLDEIKSSKCYQHSEQKTCLPQLSNSCEIQLEHEVKVLTEKLAISQKAEHEAKHALSQLEDSLSIIKKQLSAANSENANLEGWVSHLQQLVSGGYIADSSLPLQLSKAEEQKKSLEKTVESLKGNVNSLQDEKKHLRNTVEHLSKCNKNLESTIGTINKNKEILEKELNSIQKKVDIITHGTKSNDCDLSACTKDISQLLKNAYSISKSLKDSGSTNVSDNSDRRITAGIKTYTSSSHKISSEESCDSISVAVGCQDTSDKTESNISCCVKPYCHNDILSSLSSNLCHDCHYMDLKHSEISDIKTSKTDSCIKHVKSSKKSSSRSTKDSLISDKSSKTFV